VSGETTRRQRREDWLSHESTLSTLSPWPSFFGIRGLDFFRVESVPLALWSSESLGATVLMLHSGYWEQDGLADWRRVGYGCGFLKSTAQFRIPLGIQILPAVLLFG
jgi:hypothetical protein